MSTRSPDRIPVDEWRRIYPTVDKMIAGRWRITGRCKICELKVAVSLALISRLSGDVHSLWGSTRACPRGRLDRPQPNAMKDVEVWDYTFLTAVARGWGLAIRCRTCCVEKRWTDRDLALRFAESLDRCVSDLRRSLVCACGSREVSLYFYMSGSLDTGAGTLADIEAKEDALRRQSRPRSGLR